MAKLVVLHPRPTEVAQFDKLFTEEDPPVLTHPSDPGGAVAGAVVAPRAGGC
jgi:hypothetical protein